MRNFILLILLLPCFSAACQSQPVAENPVEEKFSTIQWTGFEEAVRKNEQVKKKIFIDIYTDWCGWCKRMDATTFKNDSVIEYLNRHFHPVKINAEGRDTIRFRDHVFVYRPEFKAHEIALSLLSGKLGYPSFVLLDENYVLLHVIAGYQTAEQLLPVLQHFNENRHLNQPGQKQQEGGEN
jgi:thioredoxin-related protein